MAGTITFAVSCTPSEVVQSEDGVTNINIISGEVASSLGGSGSAVVTSYLGSNAYQGIGGSDAAPGVRLYKNCVDNSATQVTAEASASFIIIKNTGKLYSSPTSLGDTVPVTGDHVLVTLVNSTTNKLAFLAPGEAFMMTIGGTGMANHVLDCSKLFIQSYEGDGTAAAADDHIAVEFLAVD